MPNFPTKEYVDASGKSPLNTGIDSFMEKLLERENANTKLYQEYIKSKNIPRVTEQKTLPEGVAGVPDAPTERYQTKQEWMGAGKPLVPAPSNLYELMAEATRLGINTPEFLNKGGKIGAISGAKPETPSH